MKTNKIFRVEDIVQYASEEWCIKYLNQVAVSTRGSKKHLKNRISKFMQCPELANKRNFRAEKA